jgi:hypothetical protein
MAQSEGEGGIRAGKWLLASQNIEIIFPLICIIRSIQFLLSVHVVHFITQRTWIFMQINTGQINRTVFSGIKQAFFHGIQKPRNKYYKRTFFEMWFRSCWEFPKSIRLPNR